MGVTPKNNWYVIQTKPLAEERTCANFKAMHDTRFSAAGVETFSPRIKCMARGRAGGDVTRSKPLFPSYIFVKWDLKDADKQHLVKYTRGVNRILGDGERPVPISDAVIDVIRGRVNGDGIIEQELFGVGDRVKVRRGILKDLEGILERPVSDSGRVDVLLRIFNREMRAKLKCSEIEKV